MAHNSLRVGADTVGRAGVDPPRMVVLEYTPPHPVGPPLGLVGKGIVFDSGGLNLKTSPSYMKGDMVRNDNTAHLLCTKLVKGLTNTLCTKTTVIA